MIEAILYIGLSSGLAVAMFGMLSLLETSRVRVADAAEHAAQASWIIEQLHERYTGDVVAPSDGDTSDELVQQNGSRIRIIDGILEYTASSGVTLLTTDDVLVSDLAFVHDGGPASRSLVTASFVLMPASSSDASYASQSYSTVLYAH